MYQLELKDVIGYFVDEAFLYSSDDAQIKDFLQGMIAALPIIMQELKWHEDDDTDVSMYPDSHKAHAINIACTSSSMISNIEYWGTAKELFITFKKSGRIYAYQNVPANIFNSLVDAESKGKYFNQNIKTTFEYVDVTEKGELR